MGIPAWLVYAVASAACAALVGIFGKIGMREVDSNLATALRSVVMAAFCLVAVTVMRLWPKLSTVDGKAGGMIVLAGIAGALSWLFYFKAISLGQVSTVMPIDKLSVPIAVVLAALVLGERPSAINWAGAALIAAGAVMAGWK